MLTPKPAIVARDDLALHEKAVPLCRKSGEVAHPVSHAILYGEHVSCCVSVTPPPERSIVNVVGLPTSENQRQLGYAIADLKRTVERLDQLQQRLSVFRSEAPP